MEVNCGNAREGRGADCRHGAASAAAVFQVTAGPAAADAGAVPAAGTESAADLGSAAHSSRTAPAPPASRATRPWSYGGRGPKAAHDASIRGPHAPGQPPATATRSTADRHVSSAWQRGQARYSVH